MSNSNDFVEHSLALAILQKAGISPEDVLSGTIYTDYNGSTYAIYQVGEYSPDASDVHDGWHVVLPVTTQSSDTVHVTINPEAASTGNQTSNGFVNWLKTIWNKVKNWVKEHTPNFDLSKLWIYLLLGVVGVIIIWRYIPAMIQGRMARA